MKILFNLILVPIEEFEVESKINVEINELTPTLKY